MTDETDEIKTALYNFLSHHGSSLQGKHVKFILSKLNKMPKTDLTEKKINLVTTFLRTPQKSDFPSKEYWEFYWRIAPSNKNNSNVWISEKNPAFIQLSRQISENAHNLRNEIFSVIDEYLANIENRTSVLSSYEEIKALINIFQGRSQYPEKITRSKCINYLCKERCLIHRIINELKLFKEDVQKKIPPDVTEVTEKILDSLVEPNNPYRSHIQKRLNFINDLLTLSNAKDVNHLLTSELLGNLLDLTMKNVLISIEIQLGLELFEKISFLNSEHFISKDELLKFFHEKITNKEFINIDKLDPNVLAELFKILFIMINKRLTHIVELEPLKELISQGRDQNLKQQPDYCFKVPPDELEGIKDLWELALDNIGHSRLDRLLIKLYMYPNVISNRQSFLSICFAKIKQSLETIDKKESKTRVLRGLSLVSDAIEESEIEGFANLKSHDALIDGETIALKIHFINMRQQVFTKMELSLNSNMSVFDLRLKIAKSFGIPWNKFEILKQMTPSVFISNRKNGETLREVGILTRQVLFVKETALPIYRQEALFEKDDTLNPKLEKIFVEWFGEFSDNNKMSPKQLGEFTSALERTIYIDIKYAFSVYDHDRDSYLNQEEFIRFISAYSKNHSFIVWNQLDLRKYRNDFQKLNSLGQIQINIKSLPRYLLSTNNEHFGLLQSLLDSEDEEITTQVWDLISTLPTNIQILENMVKLKGVRNTPTSQAKQNMGILFNPTSPHKLLYALHTAMILIQNTFKGTKNNEREKFIKEFLWSQNNKLQEYWQSWQTDFLNHDGLAHLIEILKVLSINDAKLQTTIKCSILKIIANYLPVNINDTNDINRIPSLKKLLNLLVEFGLDYIGGKEIVASQCQYLVALQTEIQSLPVDTEQEVQALHIISRVIFRDLIESTINLCLPSLNKDEAKIDAEDLTIFRDSISILRTLMLHVE